MAGYEPSEATVHYAATVAARRLTSGPRSVKFLGVSNPRQKETNMDLNEQARRATDERFAELGVESVADARAAAAILWLDGYKAGMFWMQEQTDAAFTKLQAARP